MTQWLYLALAIAGVAVATIFARGLFFVLPASIELPPGVERALRYAPACALTAIIVPSVLAHDGRHVELAIGNPRLWGTLAAALVFLRTRSMAFTLGAGMAVFTVVRLAA